MGSYKYINETFQNEYKERSQLLKNRISAWSVEPSVFRIERPTNIARARELGYKSKQGVVMARVRVLGGLRRRRAIAGGRKPSRSGQFFSYDKSLQSIAEERAARKFSNCEVLNSYYVAQGNNYKFFEVILLDRSSPSIKSDSAYASVIAKHGRAYRGLTSSGRKHRGLLRKGFGTEKNRPSVRSGRRGLQNV